MEVSNDKILAGLNDKQIEAVRAVEGPVLILAGAARSRTRQKIPRGCSTFAVNMVK